MQVGKNARREHDREHSGSINKRQQVYYSNLIGSAQHCRINEKKRQPGELPYAYVKSSMKGITLFDWSVSKFKTLIKIGPVLGCVACNRCHYQKSVIFFKMNRYNVDEDSIFMVMSCDGNHYICNTCDKALQNNRMPCQTVANKLFVEDLPKQFQDINRLERLLASRGILLKKVTVMPKGKSLKMKDSICNIPVTEVDFNCNT